VSDVGRAAFHHDRAADRLECGDSLGARAAQPMRHHRNTARSKQCQAVGLVEHGGGRRRLRRRAGPAARGLAFERARHQFAMRKELMQRGDRFGLGREYRAALRGKLVGDAALGRGNHQRLAGLPAECRGIARKGFDVVTGAGHRHADQERVGRGVLRDHRQDVAEQPAVGEQRRREIDRIGGGGKARQDAFQFLVGLISQLRHRHSHRGGGIRGHHADRAGIADGDQTPSFRLPAFQIKLGGLDQPAHVRRAPDAVMLEERIDHAVLIGERAGVRLRGLPAGLGAAGL
jgi:hypothetical protein